MAAPKLPPQKLPPIHQHSVFGPSFPLAVQSYVLRISHFRSSKETNEQMATCLTFLQMKAAHWCFLQPGVSDSVIAPGFALPRRVSPTWSAMSCRGTVTVPLARQNSTTFPPLTTNTSDCLLCCGVSPQSNESAPLPLPYPNSALLDG